MLLYLLFNTHSVQNYAIGKLTKYVNETYHTRISIGEINYDGWTYFSLRNINFGDQKKDTTFFVGRLQFNISGLKLDSSHFILRDVLLDEGLCKITTYRDSTYSFDVIDLFSDPNDTISDPNAPPFILEFKNLECMDTRFLLFDSTGAFSPKGFDYNRMNFYETNFRSNHFKLIDDSMVFDIKNFSCKEQSGFEILRLKANATICKSLVEFKNLDMVTPYSHLKNYFSLTSSSWKDYANFNDNIPMKIVLKKSELDMKDIAFFVPEFEVYKYQAEVSGSINGPLSNLTMKKMLLKIGFETQFDGDVKMIGLPNIEETFMDIKANKFTSNRNELEIIAAMEMPQELEDLGKLKYKGQFTGFYKDFVTYGIIETDFGSAQTDLNMKVNEKTMLSEYSGKLLMNNFMLGAFLNNKDLGILTMEVFLQGRGFDLNTLNTKFQGKVNAIGYQNYTYSNIDLKGNVAHKKIDMHLNVADTNLEMLSDVMIDLSEEYTHFIVDGNLENANLKPLNLNDNNISLGTRFSSDYYLKDLGNSHGNINIEDFHYEKFGYSYKINQLKLESENEDGEKISINGDFIHGNIKGDYDIGALYDQIKYWSLSLGDTYFNPKVAKKTTQKFELDLNILTTNSISPLFFPGFNATNMNLEGSVNSDEEAFELAGYIGNIRYDGWDLVQTTFKMNEQNKNKGELLLGFKSFGRLDTLLIGEFAMKSNMETDLWKLQYQIRDTLSVVYGEFDQELMFEENDFWINGKTSWFQSGFSKWNILPGKTIKLNNKEVSFDQLKLTNGGQELLVDGDYQYSGKNKNLSVNLQNLELNTINQFVKELGVNLAGTADGYFVYKNMGNRDVVISKITAKNLSLDQDTLGDFDVSIGYREKEEDLLIDFSSLKGKITNLKGSGNYDIATKYLDLAIDFSNSKIVAFQAFVKDYVKLNDGDANLNARLKGPIDKLSLDGQLSLIDVSLKVEYLQTNYTIKSAKINFNDNVIKIVPFDLNDANNQTAKVSGQISHVGFSDLKYNIHLDDFKSFQMMKTVAKDNDLFYGNVFATGQFTMKGTSNDAAMYLDVVSEKNTKLTINPFGASTETGESYIHFVSRDTLATVKARGKGNDFGIGVYMNIKANPYAEIQVIFDAKSDDRIKAKGNGNLRMEYLPNGNFLMFGEYELTEGEYRFSAMNVVAKKFDLRRGSKITWSGDPLTGRMNIVGVYSLKTSISPIVASMGTSEDPNVRVPVDCIINIKGLVEKPEFVFDLNFPDLSTTVTGAAASELNAVVANFRREPEMMNQQMLFLLISGGFVPITNTNNSSASTFGSQTVSDLLSKQAAGLIGKAIPNFDVSVDLLNASDPTKSRTVLLSASKRFMDNRLEVQTSYAIDQTQTNLSATYNLKKNGNTKVKVFNKSGFNAIYNRNVVTSGTGLFYRKEFNEFSELFKKQNASPN